MYYNVFYVVFFSRLHVLQMHLRVIVEGIGEKNRFLKLGVEGKGRGVGLAMLHRRHQVQQRNV